MTGLAAKPAPAYVRQTLPAMDAFMKTHTCLARLLLSLPLATASLALAADTIPGQTDYSGMYDCTGIDAHEGEYTGTVTIKRVAAHSTNSHNSYAFELAVPDYGTYLGQAVSQGTQMAIYFALTDPTTRDFGTGLATFASDAEGNTVFDKFYYEPEYKGGNTGTEHCVLRAEPNTTVTP